MARLRLPSPPCAPETSSSTRRPSGTTGFAGRADILRRVDVPSALGEWSYEAIDTKLARETRGGTILQLSLYSGLVGAVQGKLPEYMYVVAPWTEFRAAAIPHR